MMDIWERFIDKGELDNTLNKDKYDSAPISIEVKTVRISQYSFSYAELQYRYTSGFYRRIIISSAKSDMQFLYPIYSTGIVKLL
jgi:hypothetical protein